MIVKALKAVVFMVCCIIIPNGLAQNASVRYHYDESGNRTRRSLIIAKAEQEGKCLSPDKLDHDSAMALANDDVSGISVYPNPTADKFTVELPEPTGNARHVALYDMTGILVEVSEKRRFNRIWNSERNRQLLSLQMAFLQPRNHTYKADRPSVYR